MHIPEELLGRLPQQQRQELTEVLVEIGVKAEELRLLHRRRLELEQGMIPDDVIAAQRTALGL